MPTALVTGSNRGIGFELVGQLAGQGWTVIATCRNPAAADKLRELAAKAQGRIEVLPLDAADHKSIKALVASLNGRPIDLLMCNAGIAGPKPPLVTGKEGERIQDYDDETWFEVFRTNLLGPVRIAGYLADNVAASERKLMGFVTTRMANIEENSNGAFYMYRASKGALNTAIKNLSLELGKNGVIVCGPAPRLGAHRLCADRAGRSVGQRQRPAQGDARRERCRQRDASSPIPANGSHGETATASHPRRRGRTRRADDSAGVVLLRSALRAAGRRRDAVDRHQGRRHAHAQHRDFPPLWRCRRGAAEGAAHRRDRRHRSRDQPAAAVGRDPYPQPGDPLSVRAEHAAAPSRADPGAGDQEESARLDQHGAARRRPAPARRPRDPRGRDG